MRFHLVGLPFNIWVLCENVAVTINKIGNPLEWSICLLVLGSSPLRCAWGASILPRLQAQSVVKWLRFHGMELSGGRARGKNNMKVRRDFLVVDRKLVPSNPSHEMMTYSAVNTFSIRLSMKPFELGVPKKVNHTIMLLRGQSIDWRRCG